MRPHHTQAKICSVDYRMFASSHYQAAQSVRLNLYPSRWGRSGVSRVSFLLLFPIGG